MVPWALGAVALLLYGPVTVLEAQELPAQEVSSTVADADLESFVAAWVAINEVRNRLHDRFAREHAVRPRTEAREEADREIEAILEENGLTAEEFAELNRLVGIDTELRARFDTLVEVLRNG